MNDNILQSSIPGAFLKNQFPLSGADLAYGLERQWISAWDVVDVLAWWWGRGVSLSPKEEEIASLFKNELWRLPDLLEEFRNNKDTGEDKRIWLYLIVAWLYENLLVLPDPLGEVEKVYSEFNHPEEIEGLIWFMPAKEYEPVGEEGLLARWKDYVRRTKAEFLAKRGS
jgi:hypothetical protein